MALFRACANPQVTLKAAVAGRKLSEVLGSSASAGKATAPLTLRRGAIREAVIEVLTQADEALAPVEVRRRAARRLGRSVHRHTIDTCLSKVVADPTTLIAKVRPGQYASNNTPACVSLDAQMAEIRDRVFVVLGTASVAMRPAEIWAAIEAEHREPMSYDAVASFLSLAAKHPDLPVERVKRGWYQLVPTH